MPRIPRQRRRSRIGARSGGSSGPFSPTVRAGGRLAAPVCRMCGAGSASECGLRSAGATVRPDREREWEDTAGRGYYVRRRAVSRMSGDVRDAPSRDRCAVYRAVSHCQFATPSGRLVGRRRTALTSVSMIAATDRVSWGCRSAEQNSQRTRAARPPACADGHPGAGAA